MTTTDRSAAEVHDVDPAHRPDIQGLRAIAVLLVVVAHSGAALPGGFIGVDVFFVVSGFVIGRLLLDELRRTGTLSLRDFYARRARRLLPALALVTLVTLAVGIVVLNPYLSQPVPFRTAGFASVFAANAYLYRHLGYFDATADGANPFLHLWSLSVEEQFYLVLPALLLVAWRRGAVVRWVAVGSLASFAMAWGLTSGAFTFGLDAPARFAFYLAPTRAWEFGAGVLLAAMATSVDRLSPRLAAVGGGLGGVAVLASAVLLDPSDPFPGLGAVPVVLGTVLLLVAGARSPGARLALSVPALRWVGDRSYAWYLWHWPAIVYARAIWRGSEVAPVVAAALSLVVAAASYALLEDRLRRDPAITGGRAVRLAAVCVVVPLIAVGLALQGTARNWGITEPLDWFDTPAGRGNGCVLVNRDMADTWDEDACTTPAPGGRSIGTALVLGDFHADSVSTALIDLAATRGLDVAEWARASCPFTTAAPAGYPACGRWQRAAMELVDRLEPVLVVVAHRSTSYTTEPPDGGSHHVGQILGPDGRRTGSEAEALEAWGAALDELLTELGARGVPVVIVGGVPDYRHTFPVPSLLRPDAEPPVRSRADVDDRHGPVVAVERAVIEGHPHARYLDPVPLLCGAEACTPFASGRWRYYDAFHLNNVGSRVLLAPLEDAVDDLLGAPTR